MSIVMVLLYLLFFGLATLIITNAYKLFKKADVRQKRKEIELVNELAEEVAEANQELDTNNLDSKRNQINDFNKK